jgi:hypothetical protein
MPSAGIKQRKLHGGRKMPVRSVRAGTNVTALRCWCLGSVYHQRENDMRFMERGLLARATAAAGLFVLSLALTIGAARVRINTLPHRRPKAHCASQIRGTPPPGRLTRAMNALGQQVWNANGLSVYKGKVHPANMGGAREPFSSSRTNGLLLPSRTNGLSIFSLRSGW